MLNVGQEQKLSKKFSITIPVRDKKGNLTGLSKTYDTDSAAELASFYERNTFRSKKKKENAAKLPKANEAEKLLKEAGEYAEKQKKKAAE